MSLVQIQRGFLFPTAEITNSLASVGTLDLTAKQYAMMGRLYIDGRSGAGSKTLSTGTIQFRTGTCTFANVGTTLDIGIQGIASATMPAIPDGTFTVKTTLTGGAGISSAAWNTATMTTGSATLSHGDLIAVVFNMTARAGSDSVLVAPGLSRIAAVGSGFPNTNAFVAGAWQTTAVLGAFRAPNVIIVFDDGTLGWVDYTMPVSVAMASESQYSAASNPNEHGLIFQVPFACKIDAFWATMGLQNANSDFTFKLYTTPTGTPTLVSSLSVLAEQLGETFGQTGATGIFQALASEITLSANTDYCLSVLATGTGTLNLNVATLGNTAHRATIPGGTTLKKATRNGSAGSFTPESPAVSIYEMGVRISSFDNGAGGGGGTLLVNPGMTGGMH